MAETCSVYVEWSILGEVWFVNQFEMFLAMIIKTLLIENLFHL